MQPTTVLAANGAGKVYGRGEGGELLACTDLAQLGVPTVGYRLLRGTDRMLPTLQGSRMDLVAPNALTIRQMEPRVCHS